MSEHTPGPWHVRDTRWHEVAVDAVSDSGEGYELVIAQCDPAVQLINKDAEIKANAALIAAAPQLLEACKLFVGAYEKSLQLEKTDSAVRMARMAIAAAEGES